MPLAAVKDASLVLPFQGANDTQFRIARSFALLNAWHAALTGRATLDEVIAILVRQAGAMNICLYRFQDHRAAVIATRSDGARELEPVQSRGSMVGYLLRSSPERISPGSIIQLSQLRTGLPESERAVAAEWNHREEIYDVSLVILEREESHIDALELTLDRPPTLNPDIPPALVTKALADAWALRQPGIVARKIAQRRRQWADPGEEVVDLLGVQNPCSLSPAELKVCHLVAAGIRPKDIASELGISMPTVRSHLSRIYQKTGTEGQLALASRIAAGNSLRREA